MKHCIKSSNMIHRSQGVIELDPYNSRIHVVLFLSMINCVQDVINWSLHRSLVYNNGILVVHVVCCYFGKDNSMRNRNRNHYRSPRRRFVGLIVLVIVVIAIFSRNGFESNFFLPLLMVVLAFTMLIGSFFTLNPQRIYGGLYGFVWLLGLALCFAFGFGWIWLPIFITALLSILARPLIAALLGLGIFSMLNRNQAPQPMYTPPMQPYQPPVQPYQPPQQQPQYYQPYGEGYQPPTEQPPLYQEGGAQYQPYHSTPSPQYEQPQSQYPQQELPPQQ